MYKVIDKGISLLSESIAATGITAGVALAFVNVVARYIFDSSLTWASELTIYFFLWSVFFGAVYCFHKDAHIAVSIIVDIVPTKVSKVMLIFSKIASLIFLFAVAYYGYQYLVFVRELEEMSVDLEIPMWIPYLVIPVSFFLMSIRVLEKLIYLIKTPHDQIKSESEAEQIIKETEVDAEELVKEVEKKTGGML
jgi:C4-dicarboxylate transporter DctQ subunit